MGFVDIGNRKPKPHQLKCRKGTFLVVRATLKKGEIVDLDHEGERYKLKIDGKADWFPRRDCIVYNNTTCTICRKTVPTIYRWSAGKKWLQTLTDLHGEPVCVGSFTPSQGCRLF